MDKFRSSVGILWLLGDRIGYVFKKLRHLRDLLQVAQKKGNKYPG